MVLFCGEEQSAFREESRPGISRYHFTLLNFPSASRSAPAAQRIAIFPPLQRLTLRVTLRTEPFRFSMGFVEESVAVRSGPTLSLRIVSVSSGPSRPPP